MAAPSSLDRTVLVRCSSLLRMVEDLDVLSDIRWYFEDPRVGGKLKPHGVVFVDSNSFILNFSDSTGYQRILNKNKHTVTIGDEEVEMTVTQCPLNIAAKCVGRRPSTKMETEDDDISQQMKNTDENFPSSSLRGFNIVPDECQSNPDETVSESFKRNTADEFDATSSGSDVRQRMIQVLDVPNEVTEILELYLESEKFDGGVMESSSYDEQNLVFVATFVEQNVAERFLSKGIISIEGHDLQISRIPEMVRSKALVKAERMETDESVDPVPTNTIQVKGVKTKLNTEVLKLYFENRKRSGGGKIEDVQVFADEELAVITYHDAEAAKRVIEQNEHSVLGIPLQCVALDGAISNSRSHAIEVRGLNENISEEMLLLFFENRKRSGGGQAEDCYYNAEEHRAVITFESPEVVERILQNHRSTPIVLNDVRLTVSPLRPAIFPSCAADIIELDKLLINNIPGHSSKDDLVRYLQRGSGTSVTKLRYSLHPGTSMAYFEHAYDYVNLRDLVSSRPFQGVMLSVQKVPASHSIQIFNISSLSIDHLMLYFENSKSGGDEIVESDINTSDNFAILKFANRDVLSSVLSKKHELSGQQLAVSVYYEGLGVMPPDVDDETPSWWLPADISLTCNSQKLSFITRSSKLLIKIEKELESLFCKVEWPALTGDEDSSVPCDVLLHCTLAHNTKNVSRLAKTWTVACKDKVDDILDNILFEEVSVLQELWKTVCEQTKLLPRDGRDDDDVRVIIDDDTCTIQIVGARQFCKNFVDSLRKLVLEEEKALEQEKRKITEQIQKLKCHQFEILKLVRFLDTSSSGGVEVVTKGMDVQFCGQPGDILAKKLKMYEILNAIISESVDLPDFVLESLKLVPFRNYLSGCLQEKKVISAWDLGPKGLIVYGLNQIEIDRTASILKSEVIQRQLELNSAQTSTILLPEWDAFKTLLKSDFKVVLLKENGSNLSITATNNDINTILELVHNFIKENTVMEDFLMTKLGTAAILSQYMKTELQTICNDFHSCHVSIKENLDISHTGFAVYGTVYGLQSALNKVVELSNKVIEREKVIDQPGMSNYFRTARGQKQIEAIQSRHRVFIEDWETANRPNLISAELKKRSAITTIADDQPQVLDEVRLKNFFVVKVVRGDITEYKVDVIVNAANGQLDHHGGVAKVIVEKGGAEIQVECKTFIKSSGSLLPGHFYVSKPGKLPCKYIIHAVGPIWENGLKNEENVLFETIYNVLEEAESLKVHSIAMPAISTGVYGFPMRKAAKITLEAVAEFVEKETLMSLREVHIIDNNRNATKEFKDMLSRHGTPFQRDQRKSGFPPPIIIDDDDYVSYESYQAGSSVDRTSPRLYNQTSSSRTRPSFSKMSSSFAASPSPSPLYPSLASSSSSSVSSGVLTTPQGLKVTLVKGSIVGQTVDVIVNTTAQNLSLNSGAVSSLILQTAGASIQVECQKKAPAGLSMGQVVVTSGYSLPCQFVYHGYCLNWDNSTGPCEQSIRSLLKAIFLEAHSKRVTSIAIPAIGTGNLKVPPDLVAKIMYEEAEDFSQTNLGTSLCDIRFVVYDKDLPTVAAFEKQLHFPSRGLKQKVKKNVPRILATSKSTSDSPLKSPGGFGGWSISINDVKLEVVEGDITRARTEAIVNSANESLNLKLGAVSAAILQEGGQEIQDECSKIGNMTDGMAITGAGKLPSKFIFHVKAHTTDRGWRKGIENCLIEAERRRIQSITFPLLGTGNIRAPVKMMASVMLDSVVNFTTKSNPQHLQVIRIAIFQPHMLEEFAQAIDLTARDHQSSGILDQFKVYVKSFLGFSSKSPAVKNFNVQELPQQKAHKVDEIRFIIYGLADQSIDTAIGDMEELCTDVIQDKVIERETIAKLSVDQVERIKGLELEFSVKITVERGHRLNRIRVQGEGQTIISVVDKIYAILNEVEEKEREEYHAEIVAKQAQWMFQCDDSYDPYPKAINLIIEKAYQGRLPFAEWEEEDGSYRLDFHRMEEMKNGDAANKVKVKRMTAESTIPKSWDVMNTDELCKRVQLAPTSQEYQDVMRNVHATAGGIVQQIVTIERIQNPSLYQQYIVRKDTMQMILQSATVNSKNQCERILWHGTSADTLESINHHGFNRSYCGKNAVVYGRGVYFAQNFNYSGSNTYAVPDSNGNKHIYLSRVLTGEFVIGNQSYFVSPSKPGSTVARYDSVVDNPASPTIFVIFSDTQAYPEYLIVFK